MLKTFLTVKTLSTGFSKLIKATGTLQNIISQTRSFSDCSTELVKWKSLSKGHFVRSFDPFEEVFSSFCHHPARPEFRSLDIFASVGMENNHMNISTLSETIRKAWARLRYLHPSLGAEVGYKEFRYIPLKDQSDIESWLERTFTIKDWDSRTEVEGFQDLDLAPAASWPMLYYFPREQRLVLRMSHMYGDAQAVVVLLQDLFTEIQRLNSGGETANGPWGAEIQDLASGAFDAAGITAVEDPSLPQPRAEGKAFEIPSFHNTNPPRGSKTQSLEFSASQTLEVLHQAKKMNLGITAFVHAALLHAGKRISPRTDSTVHSTVLIFNFRERCTGSPLNSKSRAAALRIGFWPIQVLMSNDFQRTALRIKHEYETLTHRKSAILATMAPYLGRCASSLSEEYFQGILPSFIGNLSKAFPSTYSSFRIREFWVVAVPTDERVYLGIQSYGDKLSIRICYNRTYHTDEQIASYLLSIKQEIFAGCNT